MPIKFPKFSRRKSAGNSLDAAYEPANTGSPLRPGFEDYSHNTGAEVNPYSGYGGQQYNINNNSRGSGSGSGYSGGGYYGSGSSNRLSSSSTLPSTDLPQTPASTDDYIGQRRSAGGGHSTYSSHMEAKPKTPTSLGSRSVGGQFASSPPRRMTLSSSEAPRLETTLDSTSFEDMFSGFDVNKPTGVEELSPAAPKLATSLLPPSNSESSVSGYNQPTSPVSPISPMRKPARVEVKGPLPPPKSYNLAIVAPKTAGMVKEKVQTFNTYSKSQNMYSTDATGGAERWAGRPSEEGLISPTVEEPSPRSISPRQSRSLTHTSAAHPHAPTHSRKDSLNAPPRNTRLPRTPTGDLGLKRSSAVMKRYSIHTDDEDAAVVMNSVHRSQGPRGITDRVKDRDSGWEETVASGSSSMNSIRDTASSASSRDTTQTSVTSPRSLVATRQNTEENLKPITTVRLINSTHSEGPVVEPRDCSDTEFDGSITTAAAIAAKFENSSTERAKEGPTKVMTKAQFEKYRQQQDDERRLKGGKAKSDTESEDESVEDYDSDTERNKEVIRQRAKQEAHLSVYRQQMMKISGRTGSTEALNGPTAAPMLALNNSMPQLSLSGADPGSDEDEEVPLGILMAHGFPNKSRPPTRLSNSSSQPNLRGLAQQQGIGSGRLPVFARNLPADPYNYGASLINHTNRMPIGMGGGITGLGGGVGHSSGGSVYGGSAYGGGSEIGRHPGGLIGEIALAEEMKAARKHSPSGYPRTGNRSPGLGGGMLGLGGGIPSGNIGMGMIGIPQRAPSAVGMPTGMQTPPRMGMQQPMGLQQPNPMLGMQGPMMAMDPSQMQMQQHMQQMMQMQMQWMQQMQAQQQMMQGGMNPGMMGMPRPNSVAVPQVPARLDPTMHQRTMSMVDPMLSSFNPQTRGPGYAPSIAPSMKAPAISAIPAMMGGGQPGYTPSIAPSERSTIGLPSRYRPVTQVQPGNGSRTSTMTSGMGLNWQQQQSQQKPSTSSGLKTAVMKGDNDDDDDSAWEEMKKKKEAKKEGWQKRKDLKDMLSFGGESTPTVTSP
ncbi:hypothetical protein EV426DRAFT_147038 [Tirmania nivea]|nr:hypothetical protein EV426DRAFT_147038 [Tirmania nivea]